VAFFLKGGEKMEIIVINTVILADMFSYKLILGNLIKNEKS